MQDIHYLDRDGLVIGPMLDHEGRVLLITQEQPAPKGAKWSVESGSVSIMFNEWIDFYPTPNLDGLVVLYPIGASAPYAPPNNAAIYNADGSLRFHLKTPKHLTRHFPGYVHTADEVARLEPEGIFQVGWGFGDGISDWDRPWMWARISLHCDVYEQRYFDPDTGEFDMTHFHVARR
jgi:hypothetical protein